MWIQRTLQNRFENPKGKSILPVWLLLGPRQVGKSALLNRCKGDGWLVLNLDDPTTAAAATADPILFAKGLRTRMILDEIQYAPHLLHTVKQIADADRTPGTIWMTGSQSFEVMKGVRESLAGRVSILDLYGLTDEEKRLSDPSPISYFEAISQTGFPAIQGANANERRDFLDSYLMTYVERDVRELLGVQKRREFELFVRACALRTGQVLVIANLARDVGISPVSAKEWLSVLEDSFLVKLVYPYHSNMTSRLVKAPKLYFMDAGLAAHLAGWREAESLRLGPMAGPIFETHVFSNVYRHFTNRSLRPQIHMWRTKDQQEIDLIVESGQRLIPIEIKMGTVNRRELAWTDKAGRELEPGFAISLTATPGKRMPITDHWTLAHPFDLPDLGLL